MQLELDATACLTIGVLRDTDVTLTAMTATNNQLGVWTRTEACEPYSQTAQEDMCAELIMMPNLGVALVKARKTLDVRNSWIVRTLPDR